MSYISHGEGIGEISISLRDLGVDQKRWDSCAKAVARYENVIGEKVVVSKEGWLSVMTTLPKFKAGDVLALALEDLETKIRRTCSVKTKTAA